MTGLRAAAFAAVLVTLLPYAPLAQQPSTGVHLVDVTKAAGLAFTHNNGAFGRK